MILKGKIRTTEAKAKSIKSDIEKLVTKAKKEEKIARHLLKNGLKAFEVEKLINQIGPGFKNRKGGYTRIVKVSPRVSDNASMVVMEWSEMEKVEVVQAKPAAVKKTNKSEVAKKPEIKKPVKENKTKTKKETK